jgi:hypothetical protein
MCKVFLQKSGYIAHLCTLQNEATIFSSHFLLRNENIQLDDSENVAAKKKEIG